MNLSIIEMESLLEKLDDSELKTKITEIYDTKKDQIIDECTKLLTKFNTVVNQLKSNYESYTGNVVEDVNNKTVNQINTVINGIINPE